MAEAAQKKAVWATAVAAAWSSICVAVAGAADFPVIVRAEQFGTAQTDGISDLAVDGSGAVFVGGNTGGTLPGQTPSGQADVFVRAYEAAGEERWTRQFGTAGDDALEAVAVDHAGGVFVAGRSPQVLPGQTEAGAFVRGYDRAGNEQWTRQFGGPTAGATDVTVDAAGNVYVAGGVRAALPGQTFSSFGDAFVRKYDPLGHEVWTRQFGAFTTQTAEGVAVDGAGSVFVAGTQARWDGRSSVDEGFLRRYDAEGGLQWERLMQGSGLLSVHPWVTVSGVAVDTAGNASVVGSGRGFIGPAFSNGFVRRYDSEGNVLWTDSVVDSVRLTSVDAVVVDGASNTYLTASIGTDPMYTGLEAGQMVVRKYDAAGAVVWSVRFGEPSGNGLAGVAGTPSGDLEVAGGTSGVWPGESSAGGHDALRLTLGGAGFVPVAFPPRLRAQCQDGGWRHYVAPYVFANQGQCVRFVNAAR